MLELIKAKLRRRRRYASFFQGSSKTGTEFIVATKLLESMELATDVHYRNLRPVAPHHDPPDCVADDLDGKPVGIEVTELVTREAVEANTEEGPAKYWDWRPDEVTRLLDFRVRKKDDKAFNGGPYAERVLVVHSAEPILESGFVAEALADYILPCLRQLTSAYLVLKYEPALKRCPYFRLRRCDAKG
jgi:hypothetical protein